MTEWSSWTLWDPQTEWSSPILIVSTKKSTLCFWIDYQKMNALTVWDSYSIQSMEICSDLLGGNTIFLTLDVKSGYWQVEITEKDRHRTAFTSYHDLFRFTSMAFGFRNAQETFQWAIDVVLTKVKWQFALVYLEKAGIFWQTPDGHIENLLQVLTSLHDFSLALNIEICKFSGSALIISVM